MREGYISVFLKMLKDAGIYAIVLLLSVMSMLEVSAKTITRTIEGLYVKVSNLSELSDSYNQKVVTAEGKGYKMYIDCSDYITFVPLNGSLSTEIPEERFRSVGQIVHFPQSDASRKYKSVGFSTDDYARNRVIAETALRFAIYYESKSGKKVYRVAYMKVEVESSDVINEDMEVIKCGYHGIGRVTDELWIVKKIISYDPYINIPWLKKWAPFNRYKEEPALVESELPTEGFVDPLSND